MMIKNISWAHQILQKLLDFGVREVCLCAGSRNAPLIEILEQNPQIKIWTFFEERSAGFFAFQRSLQEAKPLVVICTSGTAVAELLPSCIEADYSRACVIYVTADRPKSYRGSGAPQSIEQAHILKTYCEKSWDLQIGESFDLDATASRPLHLNLCFAEPLVDLDPTSLPPLVLSNSTRTPAPSPRAQSILIHQPLILLSKISASDQAWIKELLLKWQAPIHAEAFSGLREDTDLAHLMIRSDRLLQKRFFSSVLRIGDIPTLRFWRDLEDKFLQLPVYIFSDKNLSGLSRVSESYSLRELQVATVTAPKDWQSIKNIDLEKQKLFVELFEQFPRSEQALMHKASQLLAHGARVYLGNSLAIREWDFFASLTNKNLIYGCNRGANGIDGQISSFMGFANPATENWAFLGDLTTLYDMSGPWITPQLSAEQKHQIVVMNNSGGQIFSRMYKSSLYINAHPLNFEPLAKMWNYSYQEWRDIPSSFLTDKNSILEIIPDAQQTKRFWQAYDESYQ